MSTDTLITFLLAIGLLTIAPGLDTVVVVRNSLRGGWRDGFLTSFGICCGLFAHALLSALGVSLILTTSAELFTLFKLAGAGYLGWLGLRNLRAAFGRHPGLLSGETANETLQPMRSLREGLLSNLLNPKTAAFYLALLPQFIDPNGNAIAQSLLLAAIHFALSMAWQCGLALAAGRARPLLNSARFARGIEGVLGATLIAIGLRLAVSEQ